jgi:cytidylate kinase
VVFILAIDGPAGAGKSTVSKAVAEHLGLTLVDTGAIYRSAALVADRQGLTGEPSIASAARGLELRFRAGRVFLGDEDVSALIRTPLVSARASVVSAMPAVRAALVEGRDIGTVVFPDADLKVFLTASIEERARRRKEELDRAGANLGLDEVIREIEARDRRDSERAVAPLRAAADAHLVDTTGRPVAEIVAQIAELARLSRS